MEEEEIPFYKKWWFEAPISIIVIIVIGVVVFKVNNNTLIAQYAKQAINILEDFKKSTITADEAHTKIATLEKRVNGEKEKLNSADDSKIDWLSLSMKLSSISWELLGDENIVSSESFTISEIDEYIAELKKYH